jgi:hypothetical protein
MPEVVDYSTSRFMKDRRRVQARAESLAET